MKHTIRRALVVVAGIVAGQIILYGASFAGTKILLPLDILQLPGKYILQDPNKEVARPHNEYASDPVFEDEPERLFRNSELRQGRLPTWNPYQYAGVPNISFLSPFGMLAASVRSPRILPWVSLCIALVAGLGMYRFCRQVLKLNAWPATVAAWSYPITAFFVLWQSYSLAYPVVWLPWILCAIDGAIRWGSRWALVNVSVTTFLTLISGHLDMAGLVLLASAVFAVWEIIDCRRDGRKLLLRTAVVVAGWTIGFMLASVELLHTLDYARTAGRLTERGEGHEERPPIGLVSLPQFFCPHLYGTIEKDSFPILPEKEVTVVESPAAGYSGMLATLVLAPLAWISRRHRPIILFLFIILLLGLAWCLDVPGMVWMMRRPGLNMLSYNRFVFASSFAVIGLAAIGLEVLAFEKPNWSAAYYFPMAVLAALLGWCLFRYLVPPSAAIASTIPKIAVAASTMKLFHDANEMHRVQHWFGRMYLVTAAISVVGLIAWICLRASKRFWRSAAVILAAGFAFELLLFGYGRAAQCDPSLYYPPIPQLEEIKDGSPGRVLGYYCLPASSLQTQGVLDIRGYDGVDPKRYIELLDLARQRGSVRLGYANAQYFVPPVENDAPGSVRLPPIIDLLGVRYLICPTADGRAYFFLTNPSALPRAFIPVSVELENDNATRLARLGDQNFDPRITAYIEGSNEDAISGEGEVKVADVDSQHVTLITNMVRSGLVVLTDQWNRGWRASIDEKSVPIVRVDHALRGVIAPAGTSTIVFRYQPATIRIGLATAGVAILCLIAHSLWFCVGPSRFR